jgi:hypothetical protein
VEICETSARSVGGAVRNESVLADQSVFIARSEIGGRFAPSFLRLMGQSHPWRKAATTSAVQLDRAKQGTSDYLQMTVWMRIEMGATRTKNLASVVLKIPRAFGQALFAYEVNNPLSLRESRLLCPERVALARIRK